MVDNLKELERLLKLCRKQGVGEITLEGVSFKLTDLPVQKSHFDADADDESKGPYSDFPEGDLTPEELTFFASGGLPQDNPYRD